MLTEAEFHALAAQGYNRIPLVLESFADLDTPLSLYLKLAHQRYTFLLESVVGGERFGRYSFIGLPAKIRIRVHGIARRGRGSRRHRRALRRRSARVPARRSWSASARRRARAAAFLRRPRRLLRLRHRPPHRAASSPAARPRGRGRARRSARHAAAADRRARRHRQPVGPHLPDRLRRSRRRQRLLGNAHERLQELRRKLRTPVDDSVPDRDGRSRARESESGSDAYQAAVRRAKEYIAAGDIMQVVLSQRLQLPFTDSPLSLYRALRSLNPSPYMFYYDFGDFHVVGASPEILVRKEGVDGDAAADRRHAPARRDARCRRAARARARRRSEGDRRARDAARPRPQRRRPRRDDRRRARHRADGDRALFARDAHRVERRGHAEAASTTSFDVLAATLSGRNGERRAEGPRNGDHRRARADARAASMRAPSATSASRTTWTPPSRSARPW